VKGSLVRRILLVAGLVVACTAPTGAHATSAVPLVYVTGPESSDTWTVPVFAVPQGASLTFVNVDTARHDLVAKEFGPATQPWCTAFPTGQCPLFYSGFVGLGGVTPVLGLENLVAGQTYTFVCLIHPMTGTLVALPPLPA
jgi:plastocyanin